MFWVSRAQNLHALLSYRFYHTETFQLLPCPLHNLSKVTPGHVHVAKLFSCFLSLFFFPVCTLFFPNPPLFNIVLGDSASIMMALSSVSKQGGNNSKSQCRCSLRTSRSFDKTNPCINPMQLPALHPVPHRGSFSISPIYIYISCYNV